jgi:hypothetical protein
MTTWLLPVADESGPLDVSQGRASDVALRLSVTTTASAVLDQPVGASAAITAAVVASATPGRVASATSSTTATMTATASVASPTDITAQLVNGSGTYTAATLPLPAWDDSYAVTISNTTLATTTPAVVVVLFPTPATPNAAHEMTVTYTIGASRTWRVVHPLPGHAASADYLPTDGVHVEAGGAPSDSTTITYAWDPATQSVSVSSYTGDATVLDHGPGDAATYGVPLYYSPEVRALGTFATIAAKHDRALLAIPSTTRDLLASVNTVTEIVDGQEFYESLGWRVYSDPAKTSGISGLTNSPSSVSTWEASYGVEGQVMLHETGHVLSTEFFAVEGYPLGIDPAMPESGLTSYLYWTPGGNVRYRYVTEYEFTGGVVRSRAHIWEYQADGVTLVQEFDYWANLTYQPFIENEAEVGTLFTEVDGTVGYYTSQVDEFTAQSIMLYWAGLNGSNASGDLDAAQSSINVDASDARFVDYMKSIGAFPGTPSDSTAPGPVTSLTASAGTWVHPSELTTNPLVELAWTNPAASDLATIRVRRATGSTAPATVNDGTRIVVGGPWEHITDYEVATGTTYSYAVFARDFAGNTSTVATVTVAVP